MGNAGKTQRPALLAQSTLPLHGTPLLHSFTDSATVYPESVTVDQATGTIYVGSVKEGTLYRGKIGSPQMEVFSPAGADGRPMATGMFYANNRLVAKRNENALYRIDLATREVVPVVLPRGALETPDGMFIEGDRLYVAQNVPKAVAILRLSAPGDAVGTPAYAGPRAVPAALSGLGQSAGAHAGRGLTARQLAPADHGNS